MSEQKIYSTGLLPEPIVPGGLVSGHPWLPLHITTNIHDIDIRNFAGPILDQGPIGSCAENALATIIDLQMRTSGHPIEALSRMGLYADVRDAQGTFNFDSGTSSSVMFNVAQTKGIGNETTWAYDYSKLYDHPSSAYVQEAVQHKMGGYSEVSMETQWDMMANGVKVLLSEGKAVFAALYVDGWFMNEQGPMSTLPSTGPQLRMGGHAIAIVGYSENGTPSDNLDDYYIVKNSWGTSWGDGGYGKLGVQEFSSSQNDIIGLYSINGFNGIDWTYTQGRNDVAEMYVALLNRAPDHSGQDWWAAQGMTQAQLCNNLLACPEEQLIFPSGSSNASFIDKVYTNVLDRALGTDVSGRAFWTDALSQKSRGDVLVEILSITQSYVNGSNVQYDVDARHSRDYFNDKLDVAMHLGVTFQSDNLNVAKVALIGVTDNYDSVIAAENVAAHSLGYL